ncbi:MAG: PspC domain-containing protein [Clostridia bacterium]|mgnify:CR=1 FL=1|jgi:phage shock protein PspC (stress-responsive transcriptional regulator)|nr:PspC domain-containing protein [Clostridia bacterium]MDD4571710.1 PspC domain-containing protein [Clostridia bacterium]
MAKKVYRNNENKKLLGVCGGIAEYFGIDATIVRLAWAVVTMFTVGGGVLAYILAALILPDDPGYTDVH